jgi:hypothetical protein
MNNFKIGDKVKLKKNSGYSIIFNNITGIVCGYHYHIPEQILVYFEGWYGGHSGVGGCNNEKHIYFLKMNGFIGFEKSCYFIHEKELIKSTGQLEFNFNE